MRIGTLTLVYPGNLNYGAFLQGYALCKAIEKLDGMSATCLPYYALENKVEGHQRNYWVEAIKRYRSAGHSGIALYLKVISYSLREPVKAWRLKRRKKTNRETRFDEFSDLFQVKTRLFFESQDLHQAKVDAFVVGSDWVWYVKDGLPHDGYLGKVETDKPFYSYAASFGTLPSTREEICRVQSFAPNFRNLSCRENDGVVLLRSLGYEGAHWDVDPTLLLTRKDWETVAQSPEEKDYIAVYLLPNSEIDHARGEHLANYIKKCREKFPTSQVVILHSQKIEGIKGKSKSDIGPQDFIGYIANARYVVTNSFHGCVFCALFNTPFTVFPRFKGDTRVQNLLKLTQLEARMVSEDCNKGEPLDMEIDWSAVAQGIQNRARLSIDYLEKALHDDETIITHK